MGGIYGGHAGFDVRMMTATKVQLWSPKIIDAIGSFTQLIIAPTCDDHNLEF